MDLSQSWFLIAAGIAMMVPAGLLLVAATGVAPNRAWDTALGGLAALSVAGIGYWLFGFGLQFGGVGLFYPHPELSGLVWEWSALPVSWGTGWGMVGLRGWLLTGPEITPMAYALFLAHLPWAVTTALLPMLALRGRAPALATLVLAFFVGGVIYPIAGNWVQGGGWLAALGINLALGHGLVDSGGTGTVFLVATGVTLAALLIWVPRRRRRALLDPDLPPVHLPLLSVVGTLLLLAGVLGWLWANPLQVMALGELAPLRGTVNALLFAMSGGLVPLLYTWFVTGESDPSLTARGVAAGMIAGLSAAPFIAPPSAFLLGLLAGATVPFVTFATNRLLTLNDTAGVVVTSGLPALFGLLSVGILADGQVAAGWQQIGGTDYLGTAGQGVSGLLVMAGFQADFPGQLQAQLVGGVSLLLWGFAMGTLVSGPLALLFHGVDLATGGQEREGRRAESEREMLPAAEPSNQTRSNQPRSNQPRSNQPRLNQPGQPANYRPSPYEGAIPNGDSDRGVPGNGGQMNRRSPNDERRRALGSRPPQERP